MYYREILLSYCNVMYNILNFLLVYFGSLIMEIIVESEYYNNYFIFYWEFNSGLIVIINMV